MFTSSIMVYSDMIYLYCSNVSYKTQEWNWKAKALLEARIQQNTFIACIITVSRLEVSL